MSDSDKVFELRLTTLSIVAVIWMILGSIFIMSAIWAIIIGLIIWLAGGGVLLHFWGKNYMSRL
jgi:hypothetical protein